MYILVNTASRASLGMALYVIGHVVTGVDVV